MANALFDSLCQQLHLEQACFIDNKWQTSQAPAIPVENPATNELLGSVPCFDNNQARDAIDAAETAQALWQKTPATQRANLLLTFHDLLLSHQEQLAQLLTLEMGKPLAEAKAEIAISAAYLKWFSEEARRIYGDLIASPWPQSKVIVSKEPVGVVGVITPWNFPSSMITRKIGAALAAGCCVVIKPSELTPFSALALASLAKKAGFPAGVINVITGDAPAIGSEFCQNPKIKKLTFTGSTRVGKLLAAQAGQNMKRISMELGGNAPFIVFDDADLDAAVSGAIASKFRNSGQTCVCANRFFVHASIEQRFVEQLKQAMEKLTCGDGLDENTSQGPLISAAQVDKVYSHIDDIRTQGGQIIYGGKASSAGKNYITPTLATGLTSQMLAFKEETFGPLAAIATFETEAEAITLANQTTAGLACYFYSQDLARTFRVNEQLNYGMIGINTGMVSNEIAPFGGINDSGIGSEGSKYGINEYLTIKSTVLGGLTEDNG